MRKVVANRSVSWLRRVAVHAKVIVRLGQTPGDQHGLDAEVGLDLWREVRRLPRRQAQTVALIYLDGLSRRDTAAVLGCSEETIKTHLSRAKRTLAARLGDQGGTP